MKILFGVFERFSGIESLVAKSLLDTEQLVVLANTVGAACRAGLDKAGVHSHGGQWWCSRPRTFRRNGQPPKADGTERTLQKAGGYAVDQIKRHLIPILNLSGIGIIQFSVYKGLAKNPIALFVVFYYIFFDKSGSFTIVKVLESLLCNHPF